MPIWLFTSLLAYLDSVCKAVLASSSCRNPSSTFSIMLSSTDFLFSRCRRSILELSALGQSDVKSEHQLHYDVVKYVVWWAHETKEKAVCMDVKTSMIAPTMWALSVSTYKVYMLSVVSPSRYSWRAVPGCVLFTSLPPCLLTSLPLYLLSSFPPAPPELLSFFSFPYFLSSLPLCLFTSLELSTFLTVILVLVPLPFSYYV